MTDKIGVVLKGYPRLSETFIAQEIRELERAGFDLELISLRHPTDKSVHPVHREITAPSHYLPEYLHDETRRVFSAWRIARRLPGYRRALRKFAADLIRDPSRNRVRRFGQALVLAAEYGQRLDFLYVHFLHTPASVVRYASIMTGIPFAISAHAKDIWTIPAWEMAEKLADCAWCVTCTKKGHAELQANAGDPSKVHLVYHGIDLSRFASSGTASGLDGSNTGAPVHILAVGRAVAKKGLDTLLEALALLPGGFAWRFTHVGGGPLRTDLIAQAQRLGIAEKCEFAGALPQEDVLVTYRSSDFFVLPCRIDTTGDRDGLPNVIMEAQSQGLAVITTPVSGAPELIEEGVNGLFVDPDEPSRLAEAIEKLGRDPALRTRMGAAGQHRLRTDFDHRTAIGGLIGLLSSALGRGEVKARKAELPL